MNWNEKLKQIKEKLNLKTVDLAKLTDISPQTITDLEKGRIKNPSAVFIKGLFLNLNINPYWLFTGKGGVLIDESIEKKENKKLKEEIRRLNEAHQHKNMTIEDALPILVEMSGLTSAEREEILVFIHDLKEKLRTPEK